MGSALVKRKIANPALAAGKRFGRYKGESEKAIREADVKADEAMERFRAVFRDVRAVKDSHENYPIVVSRIMEGIEGLDYSAGDVERFSIALGEFVEEDEFSVRAGFMLSTLINNGKQSRYTVHTGQTGSDIDYLGFCNTKHIRVIGGVGSDAGYSMEKGSMTIEGDAGDSVGVAMRGGRLTVKGNAGDNAGGAYRFAFHYNAPLPSLEYTDSKSSIYPGEFSCRTTTQWIGMSGGILVIEGNAGEDPGWLMNGGEIHVEGDFKRLGRYIKRGKIYHKGKLIVDK
jgi:hypothetical protein